MATKLLSATVQVETDEKIKLIAKKEKRSFSNMVDVLLMEAIKNRELKNVPY